MKLHYLLSLFFIVCITSGIAQNRKKDNEQGDPVAQRLDRGVPPSINSRIGSIIDEQGHSTSAPTQTQREALTIVGEAFTPVLTDLKKLVETVQSAEKQLEDAGAPYTPGRIVDWVDN